MNTAPTAKDARETVRDVRQATGEASGEIQSDLHKLREDFHRLADQAIGHAQRRVAFGTADLFGHGKLAC